MNISDSIIEDDAPARQTLVGWITPEPLDLSLRERGVLDLPARNYAFKEIADILGISVTTVSTYVRRVSEKLHVRSRAQVVTTYAQFARGSETWRKPPAN